MYDLLTRIHKANSENIKLVYLTEDLYGYIFFVLGSSDFIYKIIINKKYQKCNCEDYYNHNILCKHILFILFRVIRLYRYTQEKKIFLRRNGSHLYKYTTFLYDKIFPDLDWFLFKKYYKNLKLKDNYFNVKLYDKFKNYYREYNYMIRKNLMQIYL